MTFKNRSLEFSSRRPMRPEWGSETGVEYKHQHREVLLADLRNYRRITHSGYMFYVTIIDTKHPKFIRSTDRGSERWRMRFNVFATGFMAQWMPNTVVHYGELHVYYDLIPEKPKPWCHDFTFYYDDRQLQHPVLADRYERMEVSFRESLMGEYQRMKYLLFLPINRSSFESPDKTLDEFLERQEIIVSQLEALRKRHYVSAQNIPHNIPVYSLPQNIPVNGPQTYAQSLRSAGDSLRESAPTDGNGRKGSTATDANCV